MYSESLTHIAAHCHAWSIGILHRDLSPGNIMIVEKEEPNIRYGLLIDWSLCKVFECSGSGSEKPLAPSARRCSRTLGSTFYLQYPASRDTFLQGNLAIDGRGALYKLQHPTYYCERRRVCVLGPT